MRVSSMGCLVGAKRYGEGDGALEVSNRELRMLGINEKTMTKMTEEELLEQKMEVEKEDAIRLAAAKEEKKAEWKKKEERKDEEL